VRMEKTAPGEMYEQCYERISDHVDIRVPIPVPTGGRAQEATTIKIAFSLSVERISPQPITGVSTHSFTIVLSGGNQIHERYVGGGKHALDINREATMGLDGADQHVEYRVVNANTIEMVRNFASYVQVITIFVTGKSCHIAYKATLRPGKTEASPRNWA
jgi:hypothetical protein